MAKDRARTADKGAVGETVEIVKTVVYALAIALVIRTILFQPYTIPSASMEPNLYEGDYIIVSKWPYGWSRHSVLFSPPLFHGRIFAHAPRRGDVVVFKLPSDTGKDYIKRLIGLPGDRIQIKAGQVFVNGKPVARRGAGLGTAEIGGFEQPVRRMQETLADGRSYITNSFEPGSPTENTGAYVVPTHCYFMMGDNRDNSADSRFDPGMATNGPGACAWDDAKDIPGAGPGVGFVPEENLEGRAELILLSWRPGASVLKPWTWINLRPGRFFRRLG
jgi:signal peptidase I